MELGRPCAGGTLREGRFAHATHGTEIPSEVAQDEQVDEIAEAVVLSIGVPLCDGVELLSDLESQGQASDFARAGELEVREVDRADRLDLIAAGLRAGDLQPYCRPRTGLVGEANIEARGVRAVTLGRATLKGKLLVWLGKRPIECIEEFSG